MPGHHKLRVQAEPSSRDELEAESKVSAVVEWQQNRSRMQRFPCSRGSSDPLSENFQDRDNNWDHSWEDRQIVEAPSDLTMAVSSDEEIQEYTPWSKG
jgi:hypothetical protein